MWKSLEGYRTILLNAIAGLMPLWDTALLAISAFLPAAEHYALFSYIPEKLKPAYVAAVVVMNVLLRFQTKTPVGGKK